MAFTKVVGAGIHTLAQLQTHNIHSAGIVTATKFVGEMESGGGSSTFQNVTIAGNLTVNGTTTTLDTDLMGVDKIEVAANNTTVAVAVTQSGAGDLIRLFDSTTEVLRITDDGLVGIGTNNPSWDIHAHKSSGTTQIAAKNIGGNATFYAEASSGNTAKIELMQAGTSSYSLQTGSDDALKIYRDSSEKVRIASDGKVSVGTVQTTHLLSTIGGSSNQLLVQGTEADIWMTSTGGSSTTWRILGSTGGSTHQFRIYDATNTRDAFTISNDGNIGVYGIPVPSFSAINSIAAGNVRGIEIFRDGTDTGTALKLAGDNGSGTKAWSQLGFSGANSTAHWANYNTAGVLQGEIVLGSSGNIGIHTNNPGSLVEIYNSSTSGNTVLHVHNDKTGDAAQICLEGGRTSTNDFGQVLFKNRGNVNAVIQAMGSADDGALLFKTSDTGSGNALSSYLQIAANGNIKLGKNSQIAPGARFHVEDSNTTAYDAAATTAAASLYLVNTGTNGPLGIILQNASTDGSNTCQSTISSVAEGTNKDTALTFGTRQNSDTTIRERLRIASDGKATFTNKVQAPSFGAGTVPDDHMGIHILQANPRILIKSSGTNAAKIFFGDQDSTDPGVIEYAHTSNTMFFGTNNDGNRLAIDSNGNILIGGETTTSYPVDISYTNNTAYSSSAQIGNAVEIHNLSTTAGTTAGVHMYVTGNGANAAAVHLNAVHTANGSGAFTVGTRHNAGQHIERLRVTSNGKLSITSSGAINADPFAGLYLQTAGYDIASGNAIKDSTMGGMVIHMDSNDDKSVGLWFGTNNAHWSGISGQRNNSASTWGTDLRFYTHEDATNDLTYTRERLRIHSHGQLELKVPDANPALKITPSGTNAPAKIDFNTPGTGPAKLLVQGSEKLRIKSDGRISFGGFDPANYYSTYDDFVWGATSGSVGMTIVSATDGAGYLTWADGTSGADQYRGRLFYSHGDDGFHFRTNGTASDVLHLKSNQDITVVTGEGKINGRIQATDGSGGYNRSFGCGLIKKNFYIYGDSDKYYPVEIIPYGASTMTHLAIYRAYSEHGPSDWNTATHKGGLTLEMMTRVGGWGGYTTHGPTIFYLGEVYSTLLGGMAWTAHTQKYVIWLRGGGSGGAIYHIESPNGNIAYTVHDDTSHTGTGAGYYYSQHGTAGEGNNSNTIRGWSTYYHATTGYRVYCDYIGNSTTLNAYRAAFAPYNITGAHTTHSGGAHNP